ncbi:hypothetical protein EDC04DRAFT_3101377 [Pisolithus marmoratus]|nr:hypothetical protein EDC04DRAFT_3101377 [Pisolithus marmoratus]
MSFQHFRLGQLAMSQPLPPHLQQNTAFSPNIQSASTQTTAPSITKQSSARPPYGSGDTDDGYTLVFQNLTAFQDWRAREEETHMVEFVKGDTHGSKAIPPRFKDHTKLVCARHSRSGRKKYVKKHPDRVRKVPSRKLEGQGCQASISYKTYFDTEEVRVCYVSEHSHPIGLANLPFTRRGRRAAVEAEKAKNKRQSQTAPPAGADTTPSTNAAPAPVPPPQQPPMPGFPAATPLHPFPHYAAPPGVTPSYPPMPVVTSGPQAHTVQQEQWDRMSVLFNAIREHARTYDYPVASAVALESVLIRLYLESPVGIVGGGIGLAAGMHGPCPVSQQQTRVQSSHVQDSLPQATMNGTPGTGEQQPNADMDSGIETA